MNLRQLARLAQLSPAAVSMALRDHPRISAATKKRVLRLAEKHDYRPDVRVAAVMSHLRKSPAARQEACFGVISFYDHPRPWERTQYLTRMYEGMLRRARELGYRLEPLWLRGPGMHYRRFREIIDTRGIEGLLCFGSPDLDEEFPRELDRCAVVTQGMSIRTPLHRVISHPYNDTVKALNRLHELGYRRPGLVLGRYEELRSAHVHSAAYLGWCELQQGLLHPLPILRLEQIEAQPLVTWLKHQRPDAIIVVHLYDMMDRFRAVLRQNRIRVPDDLGVVMLTNILQGSGFTGLEQDQPLMGAWAVEMLAARIANRDFGVPANPRIEMVEGRWVEGTSLRPGRLPPF